MTFDQLRDGNRITHKIEALQELKNNYYKLLRLNGGEPDNALILERIDNAIQAEIDQLEEVFKNI
jgi:hypothetical protein